jgi:hypothetical protein
MLQSSTRIEIQKEIHLLHFVSEGFPQIIFISTEENLHNHTRGNIQVCLEKMILKKTDLVKIKR